MRADDNDNDPLVCEMPVFLSKTLVDKLYVLQYPVRPHGNNYDDCTVLKTKVRPHSKHLEIELGLRTRGPTYDRSKGEQIALNVDGAFRDKRDSEDNYYKSSVMDKLVLTSSCALSDVSRYAVGVVTESGLHLSPISAVCGLRPSFSYLDQADKRSRFDRKDASITEDSDDEDKTRKVTVRFEKPETEKSRKSKEKSYGFLQRKIREDPWIEANFHKYGSDSSYFNALKLHCKYESEHIDQFNLDPGAYLKQLVPPTQEVEATAAGLPAHLLSRSALAALPLHDRVKTVMLNAVVASFGELVGVLWGDSKGDNKGKGDADGIGSVLRVLQQVAVLVQGNWVVKSDLVYPKGGFSESGVPNDLLQRARDYLLYQFSQGVTVVRSEVCDAVGVPGGDLQEVLSTVAKYKGGRTTWEFILPPDATFNTKYPEVFQRQQMIWQSRSEQLAHTLKNKQNKLDETSKGSGTNAKKSRSSSRIKVEPVDDMIVDGTDRAVPTKPQRGTR